MGGRRKQTASFGRREAGPKSKSDVEFRRDFFTGEGGPVQFHTRHGRVTEAVT